MSSIIPTATMFPSWKKIPSGVVKRGLQGNPPTYLVGGWPTPLKNMKVGWDDDIPNIWKNKKMFQTTNQL